MRCTYDPDCDMLPGHKGACQAWNRAASLFTETPRRAARRIADNAQYALQLDFDQVEDLAEGLEPLLLRAMATTRARA